jgi:alpha-L-rhamnosidase
MYRFIGMLHPVEEKVGFKAAVISPRPFRDRRSVKMARETAAGRYEVDWEYREGEIHLRVVVPFDCEAVVELPGGEKVTVQAGECNWDIPI